MDQVTADDVTMAYRMFLGREPESSEAIEFHRSKCKTFQELRFSFIRSAEFQMKHAQASGSASPTTLSANDIVLKHLEIGNGRSVKLALPANSTDPIVTEYLRGGNPNSYMLDMMLQTTEPKDRIIDLGTHVGTFCIPAAGLDRNVLAVDAAPTHIALLKISKLSNALNNLTLVWNAIAEREGSVQFIHSGLFGHVDFKNEDQRATTVQAKSLAQIVSENGFEKATFIKADIEGSELIALQSIEAILAASTGPAILYESNAETFANAGYSIEKMRLWLEAAGYKTFRIEDRRWIYAPPDQIQPELWVDMLALKARHQTKFKEIIDMNWPQKSMHQKLIEWGSRPHANVRRHVLDLLEADDSLLQNRELTALRTNISST